MTERTIAYQPALDGVRALAVAVVLLFHAEVPGFDGGYLGVSVFFTLSGYLITSLLVHEHDRTGTISLGAFYARRVRRLLPASAACLAAIVVLSIVTDWFAGVSELRRQVVGCVLQVANWVFLAGEGSYQEIFQQTAGARSPLEHFWSLAIEEQFYWIWPPTMLFVLGRVRDHRARVAALAGLTAAFSACAPIVAAVWGPDAAYWASPARVAEILMGALLAVALSGGPAPDVRAAAWVGWLTPAALVALGAAVVLFPASGGPAYHGWLPAVGVASALLVLGLQVDGPVRRIVAMPPLVWLGRISYGVYLYHWPVYVIADEDRLGIGRPWLVLVQLAITLALAQLSYMLLEQPIRAVRGARLPTFALGGMATAVVAVAAVTIVPRPLGDYWQVDADAVSAAAIEVGGDDGDLTLVTAAPPAGPTATNAQGADDESGDAPTNAAAGTEVGAAPSTAPLVVSSSAPSIASTTAPTPTEPPLPQLSRPVRILVAGDSTAQATGTGLQYWAAQHPDLAQVEVLAAPGCGFLTGGERREQGWKRPPSNCDPWISDELPDRIAEVSPDVVMLMVTTWDLVDHRWDGVEYTPLDDQMANRLALDYAAVTDSFLASGAGAVAWVEVPVPNILWANKGTGQEDPARHEVVRRIISDLAADRPGEVGVAELATWLDESGLDDDRQVRPDGVHFEPGAALDIAERFLGERLIGIALA